MWRHVWFSWLNSKDDNHLCAVMIMRVFLYTHHLNCPPPHVVTLLVCNPKLIKVNEFPLWYLINATPLAVPESPHTKLHIRMLCLATLGGCPILCDIHLL
jgi:hypothetical protein